MPFRTMDLRYEKPYWDTYDNGAGYGDSVLWEDMAHIFKEMWGYDFEDGSDVSGNMNVVDLGCAMGFLVKHLRRRGFDAWGMDISDYAVNEKSEEEIREFLRVWDMSGPDGPFFGWESFDKVICLETLEHIESRKSLGVLRRLGKILKPGGQAVLAICVLENPGWESDPTHVNVRPREYWAKLLPDAGFNLVPDGEDFLREFAYWRNHNGIFVVEK